MIIQFGQISLYCTLFFIIILFFSVRDLSIVFASYPSSWATSILLFLVANLFFRVIPYYGLVFQLLLAAIVILAVRTYPANTKRLNNPSLILSSKTFFFDIIV
jgi:hypothetical protein